jgi:TRAP-type C4-dicarboxylate transport system permease small subunit
MTTGGHSLAARGSQWLAWIGGGLMLVSAVLISLDVITRNLFASTFFESFELSTYALAATVSFGFAFALTSKAHIRIEVVYILLPLPIRRALDLLAILALLAVTLALAWFGAQTAAESWSLGARSNSALSVPLAIPQGVWVAGLVWFCLATGLLALRAVLNLARGRGDLVEQEVGVASLAEEIEASTEPRPHLDGVAASPEGG